MKRLFWATFIAALLQLAPSIGSAQHVAPLILTEPEIQEIRSPALFTRRLGRISFNPNGWKFQPGAFWDAAGDGYSHIESRISNDYLSLLRDQLYQSGIFPNEVKDRVALNVSMLEFKQSSSVGADMEQKNPLTSGSVLTTRVTMSYELMLDDKPVGAWRITTSAASNSIIPYARPKESTDTALKRNLRSFVLRIIADFSPEQAPRANAALAALGSETDNTRTVIGYLVLGAGKVANATATAVGTVASALAENSGAIAAGMAQTSNQMAAFNAQQNQAYQGAFARSVEGRNARTAMTSSTQVSLPGGAPVAAAAAAQKPTTLSTIELPNYRAQVATISTVKDACPPGSSPARYPNGQYKAIPPSAYCIKDPQEGASKQADKIPSGASERVAKKTNSDSLRNASNDNGTRGGSDSEKRKTKWGPVKLEAVAICNQSPKNGKWQCYGPVQNEPFHENATLEEALRGQHCAGGTLAAGGPSMQGVQWNAYRCGHSLGFGDNDIAKRYSLITPRASYICPADQLGDGRCTVAYDGQDKR